MLKTELKLPFVWYTAKSKQHRYRPQNLSAEPFCLIAPAASLLPFQIKRVTPGAPDAITELQLYDLADNPQVNLLADAALIEVKHTATDEYLTYKGDNLSNPLPVGCYYAKLVKGASEYYSEVFKVYTDVSAFLKLEWFNDCDIDPLMYQTGLQVVAYLDSYTEAIPPEVNEEGDNDGQGEFVPTLQRIVHKHKVETFAPDYLLDALTSMQVHGTIILIEGPDTVHLQRTKVTADYGENYAGTCKIEFELPGSYTRTNCCTDIVLID